MIDFIDNIANATSKKFILRALIGTINGALVGAIGSTIRRQQPKEGTGIDGFNTMRDSLTEREAPVGLQGYDSPADVAAALMGVKARLYQIGAEFHEVELPGDLGETIDYMINREPPQGGEAIKQLAAALQLSVAELEAARQEMFRQDREWLEQNREDIVAMQHTLDYVEPETAFDKLPPRLKARIADRCIKAVERQTSFAVQAVLRGRLAAASDVTLNRDVVESINKWCRAEAGRDPQFNEAMEQAA